MFIKIIRGLASVMLIFGLAVAFFGPAAVFVKGVAVAAMSACVVLLARN